MFLDAHANDRCAFIKLYRLLARALVYVRSSKQEDLESVASLFGHTKALRGVPLSRRNEAEMGASLDDHVQVVMRTMKEHLRHLREGPLQVLTARII